MSGIATAIVGSAVIGGITSSRAASSQASASTAGMAAEERIAQRNLAFQEEQADIQRADFAPWRDAGENALNQIEEGISSGAFTMENFDFTADPGYQFRMQEGIDARDASASARGRLLSGAQNKAITDYGQNFASNEYANAYAREEADRTKKYNVLSNLNQGGQASAAGQAQTTGNLAATSGNIMANTGQSQNVAAQEAGAARAGAYTGIATSANQGIQNWLTYKMNT
jgi:hypothetical protein